MTESRISNPPPVVSRLLTAADVARDTGLSQELVYRLHRRGELPSVKFGRGVRFPESAIRDWIENGGRPVSNETP